MLGRVTLDRRAPAIELTKVLIRQTSVSLHESVRYDFRNAPVESGLNTPWPRRRFRVRDGYGAEALLRQSLDKALGTSSCINPEMKVDRALREGIRAFALQRVDKRLIPRSMSRDGLFDGSHAEPRLSAA
jgi:hypothetical protein